MKNIRKAFVIMQIGNTELDKLYSDVYYPAIKESNLEPKRIDKDNEGNLLKKEIVENIESADIIIADLTNERPNCYLEVGYAMGLDKYNNLIFTAREDHYPDSPNYKKGGPKIHFDVAGYDILFWDKNKLDEFKTKLVEKIGRRLLIVSPNAKRNETIIWDESWVENQRNYARNQIKQRRFSRYLEVLVSPLSHILNISQNELLDIADKSQIIETGWPIGVVFKNVNKLKPTPKSDGIISEVDGNVRGNSYDFSYFKKNGQIFITRTLLEDRNYKDSILVETRISEMTELLMYLLRFYSNCNLPKDERIKISIKFSGLVNNALRFTRTGLLVRIPRKSIENDFIYETFVSLSEIENNLAEKVYEILKGFFMLFDFYELEIDSVKSSINEFTKQINNARR